MATQRLTIAVIAGESAAAVVARFRSLESHPDAAALDRFCAALRANGLSLPIVYFCEWLDHWLMGDMVPEPGLLEGKKYQAFCFSPGQAATWARQCRSLNPEEKWLAFRLQESAVAWELVAQNRAIVLVRESVGPSTTDDDVKKSLKIVPQWLLQTGDPE